MKSVLLLLIDAYRATLAPLLGGYCRFEPSCSRYASEAIQRHGASHGLRLAVSRLARCHPFHAGGFDPVPEHASRESAGAATVPDRQGHTDMTTIRP